MLRFWVKQGPVPSRRQEGGEQQVEAGRYELEVPDRQIMRVWEVCYAFTSVGLSPTDYLVVLDVDEFANAMPDAGILPDGQRCHWIGE